MKTKIEYRIEQDQDPSNPRKEWDNAGHMVCWHRNYLLGDDHDFKDAGEFLTTLAQRADDSVERRIEWWNNEGYEQQRKIYLDHSKALDIVNAAIDKLIDKVLESHYVILPLYLYDHGGITMSTGRFSCPWDSGQVGYIYMSRNEILHEWGKKGGRLTAKLREQAEKYLEAEVETYDQYLTGDVHGYVIERVTLDDDDEEIDREEIDSCWGFFGEDYCEQEAQRQVEYWTEQEAIQQERETLPVASMGI